MSKKNNIMKYGTAVWLIENSCLTFSQIANFCNIHELEVENIANCEPDIQMHGENPITIGKLSKDDIKKAEKDPNINLKISQQYLDTMNLLHKTKKNYTPVAVRKTKPDGILWLINKYPEVKDSDIIKLVGTTKATIKKIRDGSHSNIKNIVPQNPSTTGLCTKNELNSLDQKM